MSQHWVLMARVHGDDWPAVPEVIRRSHEWTTSQTMTGTARVERGTGLWSRLVGWLFGFPNASDQALCRVEKRDLGSGRQVWTRDFGGQVMRSVLHERDGQAFERFGPVTFQLGIKLNAHGQVEYPVKRANVGPVPLPNWLLPVSIAREFEQEGRYHFDVEIRAPFTRELIVRYRGSLEF